MERWLFFFFFFSGGGGGGGAEEEFVLAVLACVLWYFKSIGNTFAAHDL